MWIYPFLRFKDRTVAMWAAQDIAQDNQKAEMFLTKRGYGVRYQP